MVDWLLLILGTLLVTFLVLTAVEVLKWLLSLVFKWIGFRWLDD